MTTVSSCGVKLQQVLLGLERQAKTLGMHMHFCGFSQRSSLNFFLSTCGVTRLTAPQVERKWMRVDKPACSVYLQIVKVPSVEA